MATDPMRQLPLPGVLVLVSTPSRGTIVADNVGWQRAVAQAGLAPAAKLVALILASHVEPASGADRDVPAGSAVCAPGLRVLVTQTKYSRTHVQRQLALLRRLGWLTSVGRPAAGRPARFVLTLPQDVARSAGVGLAAPSTVAASTMTAGTTAAGASAAGASAAGASSGRAAAGAMAAISLATRTVDAAAGRLDRLAAGTTEHAADFSQRAPAGSEASESEASGVDELDAAVAAGAESLTAESLAAESPAVAGGGAVVAGGGHLRRRLPGRTRATRSASADRGRARIAGTLARLGARPTDAGSGADFTDDARRPEAVALLTDPSGRRPTLRWTPLPTYPVAPPSASPSGAEPMPPDLAAARLTDAAATAAPRKDAAQPGTNRAAPSTDSALPRTPTATHPTDTAGSPTDTAETVSAAEPPPTARGDGGRVPLVADETSSATASPDPLSETAEAAAPTADLVVEAPRDPITEAAGQVVAILARAMRCEPEVFTEAVSQLVDILNEGGWSAPTLATHLVHLVVGGVKVGSDSPADGLAWRLKHLPKTSDECPCGACRSWRAASATPRPGAGPADPAAAGPNPPMPDLAEIERAAAVGAEQAALLARARAS